MSSFYARLRSKRSYAFGDTRVPLPMQASINVQPLPNCCAHHLLFRTLEDKEVLPQKLFWIVVFNAFIIANVPTARISAAVFRVFEVLPDTLSKKLLPLSADMQRASEQITEHVFVPLKELLFLLSLLALIVAFSETRLLRATSGEQHLQSPNPTARWLIYLSAMTSSFLLTDFQWPGYSDQLPFSLVLLMATIPMTSQARLATLALCLLNHDGIVLALIPVILCCFPKAERVMALLSVGLFYGIVLAGYGFSIDTGLQGQNTVTTGGSVWEAVLQDPEFFLASLFFTYKLLWIAPVLALAMTWNQKDKATLSAIVGITFFPLLLTLLAWDTTRVAGFGWLGLLITLGVLMREWRRQSKVYHYALLALASVNLIIPSYNVVLFSKESFSKYPYPGFYMLIDSTSRLLLK
jgi:hypothetical protein